MGSFLDYLRNRKFTKWDYIEPLIETIIAIPVIIGVGTFFVKGSLSFTLSEMAVIKIIGIFWIFAIVFFILWRVMRE